MLYRNDHPPPHFHAQLAEYQVLIEIKTGNIIRGKLPLNKQRKILDWAKDNEKILMGIWNSLNK